MVRSEDSPAPPWKESVDSAEVSAVPKKLTPPETPLGLTVVPGVGRIFLTWNENKERDLDGYHVYRSEKSGKDYVRLTDKVLNRTTYSDETVKPRITYYYTVTSVDKYGNESKPSKEQKAYAEKLR
jgi:fibronectin type 3 domain-containing protein